MHAFLVRVQMVSQNDKDDVAKVKSLFEEALRESKKDDMYDRHVRNYIKERLPDLLGRPFLIWVEKWGKSYWLNVNVKDRKTILIYAGYKSLDTLKEYSTYKIAKWINSEKKLEEINLPTTLKEDVKDILVFLKDWNSVADGIAMK